MNHSADIVPDVITSDRINAPRASIAGKGRLTACVMLGILYFLPPALPFLSDASSFAVGTAVSLAMFWLFYAMGLMPQRTASIATVSWLWGVWLAAFIVLHLIIASQFGSPDFGRALSSLALLMFMLVSAERIGDALFAIGDRELSQSVAIIALVFLGVAAMSIAGIQPPSQSFNNKPIFPYTEPSFFAIAFAPVLIYLCVSMPLWARLIWLSVGLVLGLLLMNLTLLIVVFLAAIVSLPILILVPALLGAYSLYSTQDIAYFNDRLNFTLSSTNLSSLVYIQGWQMLGESLRNTMGWGAGFQQMGLGYTNVPASIRIFQLIGFDLNQTDGSFILSKIGSEFGVFGILISILAIYLGIKSSIQLRLASRGKHQVPASLLLCHSIVLGGMIELMVRGTNYFTGSIVLFLSACFFILKNNIVKIKI